MRFFLLIVGFLFLCACNRVDENGFSLAESGVKYKLIALGDGNLFPDSGKIVLAKVKIKNFGDTLLFDSGWKHSDAYVNINYTDSGVLNSCLGLMKKGDSAQFITMPDTSILNFLEPQAYKHKLLKLEIVVNDIFTLQEYIGWKKEMAWLHDQELQEQLKLKSYLDSMYTHKFKYLSGIYYTEIKEGSGVKPSKGNAVYVHYKASFLDGRVFDTTYEMNEPFVFNFGDPDQVIAGFETGLRMMKENGKSRFVIPSQLAFGGKGSSTGIVPPFSTLVYDVELIKLIK